MALCDSFLVGIFRRQFSPSRHETSGRRRPPRAADRVRNPALRALTLVTSLGLLLNVGCAKQGADENAPGNAPNTTSSGGSVGQGGAASAGGSTTTVPSNVGSVAFSVPSGTFATPFTVALSTTTPNAVIRYTSDGTAPSASSTEYTGSPLNVNRTTRFVATQFVDGVEIGTATSAYYVQRSADITSDLPIIVVDDYGAGAPGQDVYLDAAFMIFEPKNGVTALTDPPTVSSRIGFHVRGQTSAEFDKKSYRVELRDHLGSDTDIALLGMPADSDWVLYGPFADKTLIRNALIYSMGPDLGFSAPRFVFTELYLNTGSGSLNADSYVGLYLLVEKLKNSKDRLDLQQLRATDTTLPTINGAYIFKFELDVAEAPILTCTPKQGQPCWVDLEVYDPSPLNAEQQTWLNEHIQTFHNTLFGTNFSDPTNGYAAYIDVDSFVNYFVLSEVTRNLDGYIRSLYMHKDRDGKIVVGPLWDYDLIAGAGLRTSIVTDGWQYSIARNASCNGWLQRMITDPAFWAKVTARYRELRAGIFSDASLSARISTIAAPLTNAANHNFQKWPNLRTATIVYFTTPTASTWQGQVDAMKTWFTQRLAWLDGQMQ